MKFEVFERELSKLIRSGQKVTPLFVDIERKKFLLFLGKAKSKPQNFFGKFLIISNNCFRKIVFLVGSNSCSNQIKLGIECILNKMKFGYG